MGAELQVHVTFPNERSAGKQLRVELLTGSGIPVSETLTNEEGQASFILSGIGNFKVRVSGQTIHDAVSDLITVEAGDHTKLVYIQVQPKADVSDADNRERENFTSAADLRVPSGARKSFDKGVDAMQKRDFQKAADLFQKAINVYPEYDAAFDNLGVALMSLGQADKARAAFERAVQLNDKNPDADRNYARILIKEQQYAQAKEYLQKALMTEPQDLASLTLLAITQFKTRDFDGAIQSAGKVHELSHQNYAIVHYIAGRAYENKHNLQSATAEYQTYLKENPNGPEATQVRASLARVTTTTTASQ